MSCEPATAPLPVSLLHVQRVVDPENYGTLEMLMKQIHHLLSQRRDNTDDFAQRVAFYGFGDDAFRVSFYRLLQTCFFPEWHWSSETGQDRWEMLVSFKGKMQIPVSMVERLCALCRNDITCDAFEKGVTDSLVTFVQRIDRGKRQIGWMRNRLRVACMKHYEKMLQREQMERVQQETGMQFTSGNMLHCFHEWRNSMIEIRNHQEAIRNLLLRQDAARDSFHELLIAVENQNRILRGQLHLLTAIRERNQGALENDLEESYLNIVQDATSVMQYVTTRQNYNFDIPIAMQPKALPPIMEVEMSDIPPEEVLGETLERACRNGSCGCIGRVSWYVSKKSIA
ncbi:hypothetical protein GUITHDRAFT_149104 [Guillardia theta CCMP2712]|uniref:Uncharacterized protein n=1 Tax=Guillardia theta (strain CCMP2712) TaxID=905079 RepID=L1I660_GUITC|nr:hypothetical protein GUITHDRAFT_149104 [Guillardia theta CCMP2712]EKX31731.1 hypothetical protein GUITHDRAFT_149104 [Guillardia theta CCMP2712]|eukprot:XP_005818711.1 hypothetical protein GUITHDRAFT_149104 [Guillardia theta CCMP2712]